MTLAAVSREDIIGGEKNPRTNGMDGCMHGCARGGLRL